jgi:hypothetical protein
MSERVRELTIEERMVWGVCPVCDAPDGEPCNSNLGLRLGSISRRAMERGVGVHNGRLMRAPRRVREVPA